MNISGSPIGIFLTPFKDFGQMPARAGGSGIEVVIDVFPQHRAMINNIINFQYVIVLHHYYERAENGHIVTRDPHNEKHGTPIIESAKYLMPIGCSVMRLKGILGSLLVVEGIDVLDQTPVLDLQPYLADFYRYDAELFEVVEEKFCRQKQLECHAEWGSP